METVSSKNSTPNILLVEDNSRFASAVSEILKADYNVTVAPDPQGAMLATTKLRPDLILLDYGLPQMSGLDFLKILKRRMNVPVIMLTGERDPETIIDTMKAGASDYVIKGSEDFEPNLRFRISQVLEHAATMRPRRPLGSVL